MKAFWKSLKFWISDTFVTRGNSVPLPPDALRKTVKDASHVSGGDAGVTSHKDFPDRAIKAQNAYVDSFKKDWE